MQQVAVTQLSFCVAINTVKFWTSGVIQIANREWLSWSQWGKNPFGGSHLNSDKCCCIRWFSIKHVFFQPQNVLFLSNMVFLCWNQSWRFAKITITSLSFLSNFNAKSLFQITFWYLKMLYDSKIELPSFHISYLKGMQAFINTPFTLYLSMKLLKKWTLENEKNHCFQLTING